MDPRFKEHFIGIDVPDPGHESLIEKNALYPPAAHPKSGRKGVGRNPEGFRTQRAKLRTSRQLGRGDGADKTEFADILELELSGRPVEPHDQTDMTAARLSRTAPQKAPRHLEVKNQNPVPAFQKEVFPPATDGDDGLSGQSGQLLRIPPEKFRPQAIDPGDPETDDFPPQASGDGFDFGQFGHFFILSQGNLFRFVLRDFSS
jgi:hypothetical protein